MVPNVTTVYHPWISIETVLSRNPSTNLVGPSAARCTQVTSLKEEDFADAIGPDWRTSPGLVLTVRVGGVVGLKALLICWLGGCRAGVEYINYIIYIIFLTGLVKIYRRTTWLSLGVELPSCPWLAFSKMLNSWVGRWRERDGKNHGVSWPHRQRPTKLDFSGALVAEIAR